MSADINQSKVLFRLAKKSDARALAKIHLLCGDKQVDSFMEKLGKRFLTSYYATVLECKYSVIVVGYRDIDNEIYGFHSGTIDTFKQRKNIQRKYFYLGLSAIFCLIRNPLLITDILKRYQSLGDNSSTAIVREGPRGEYWAWRPGAPKSGAGSIHRVWHHVLFNMGARSVKSEVNVSQPKVRKAVRAMGGKVVSTTVDFNGNERLIVEYDLAEYCRRFPTQSVIS